MSEVNNEAKSEPKKAPKTPRRLSRELALAGLYQWLLSGNSIPVIEEVLQNGEETRDEWARADRGLLLALLRNVSERTSELEAEFLPFLDRPVGELSPIERAVLWLGTYELKLCPETPYRVVINEAIELAKNFGGTDGHRFVNGVLDKLAPQLRAVEVEKRPQEPTQEALNAPSPIAMPSEFALIRPPLRPSNRSQRTGHRRRCRADPCPPGHGARDLDRHAGFGNPFSARHRCPPAGLEDRRGQSVRHRRDGRRAALDHSGPGPARSG